MSQARLISAIGTPLTEDESLHVEGLKAHLEDQFQHEIEGLLVAGSMGQMQVLDDQTYRDLIRESVELATGKAEILVGAGDTAYTRTRQRIEYINQFQVDGVAVLAPFMWKFGQSELIDYYRALADVARAPLYLYDLPQVTGTKLEWETMFELARHPNIAGAKCSDKFDWTRQLIEQVDEQNLNFRVIMAQPHLLDILVHFGFRDHLDGMWAWAPHWSKAIVMHTEAGEHGQALAYQRDLSALQRLLIQYGIDCFTVLMNERGIPGEFGARPRAKMTEQQRQQLLNEPLAIRLLQPVVTSQ